MAAIHMNYFSIKELVHTKTWTSIQSTGRFVTKKNQPEIKLNEEADELHLSEMMDSFVLGLNVSVHIEHTNLHQHTHTHCLFLFYLFTLSFVKHTHTHSPTHTPYYSWVTTYCSDAYKRYKKTPEIKRSRWCSSPLAWRNVLISHTDENQTSRPAPKLEPWTGFDELKSLATCKTK